MGGFATTVEGDGICGEISSTYQHVWEYHDSCRLNYFLIEMVCTWGSM